MDKRIKHFDRAADVERRDAFFKAVVSGEMTLPQAVKEMQKLSRMTQPEFAKHRGISVQALRQIQAGKGNPTVDTLDKIAAVFGLRVGFVPLRSAPVGRGESESSKP